MTQNLRINFVTSDDVTNRESQKTHIVASAEKKTIRKQLNRSGRLLLKCVSEMGGSKKSQQTYAACACIL